MSMLQRKPYFDEHDLAGICFAELRGRVGRISNQQARHIAVRLWRFLQKAAQSDDTWQTAVASQDRPGFLLKTRKRRLLQLLEQLREVDLGDMLVEGPESLQERFSPTHPLGRLIRPQWKPRNTDDLARFMLDHLEFLIDPSRRSKLTGSQVGRLLLMIATLATGFYFLHSVVGFAAMGSSFSVLIIVALFLLVGAEYFVRMSKASPYETEQVLALYISFTDEFIDDERQYEDSLVVKGGW
ncbi:hypothetical protein KDL29_13785 [bacterium]|nr:hypothetical protein [bacterium]